MFTVIKLRKRIGPGEFGAPFPKIWFPSVPIKVTRTEPDLSNTGIRRFAQTTTVEKLICNKVFVLFFLFLFLSVFKLCIDFTLRDFIPPLPVKPMNPDF